ncbi:hypothetical protein Pcinc_035956, partial [Petrolisthes cinctipes]
GSSKRIKMESGEEDSHGATSEDGDSTQQRPHHPTTSTTAGPPQPATCRLQPTPTTPLLHRLSTPLRRTPLQHTPRPPCRSWALLSASLNQVTQSSPPRHHHTPLPHSLTHSLTPANLP